MRSMFFLIPQLLITTTTYPKPIRAYLRTILNVPNTTAPKLSNVFCKDRLKLSLGEMGHILDTPLRMPWGGGCMPTTSRFWNRQEGCHVWHKQRNAPKSKFESDGLPKLGKNGTRDRRGALRDEEANPQTTPLQIPQFSKCGIFFFKSSHEPAQG